MNWENKYISICDGTKTEQDIHKKIAKQCKLNIIEIGVLFGETSRILAEINPNVMVFGIDPIITDSMDKFLIGSIDRINENTKHLNNYKFIKDYSYNIIKNWNLNFDYIFIDGDHIYENVKKDFDDWFPKLEKEGFVAIHDSTVNRGGPKYWQGPSKLADDLIFDNRLEFIESVYALTLFKKK